MIFIDLCSPALSCRTSGLDKSVNVKLLEKNNNRGKGDTHQLFSDYYSTLDPSLLQQIIGVYQNDFRIFGYTPDGFLDTKTSTIPPLARALT